MNDLKSETSGIHTDHIREDGTIDDSYIETYYHPCKGVQVGKDYLRINADGEGFDVETRVSFATLESLGLYFQSEGPDNKVERLTLEEIESLNPGIIETVRWLRNNKFQTCDSGDGETRDHECDPGVPYVHMKVRPSRMVAEADRLASLLKKRGIEVQPMNEEGTSPSIEAAYNPADGMATLTLWNVRLKSRYTEETLQRLVLIINEASRKKGNPA